MKSLDFAAMENVQGGAASGMLTLSLPISGLLSVLGMGAMFGVGLQLGLSFNFSGLNLAGLSL
jgi:hypothetical protein